MSKEARENGSVDQQRSIIVTGGLRGLGLEISKQLLRDGKTKVVALSRSKGEHFTDLCSEYGDRIRHVEADLTQVDQLKPLLDEAFPTETNIQGLVNNAAVAYDDLATNLCQDELIKLFQVNVFATMELSKWAIRRMLLHRTAGSIVHVSSISAHTGYKGLSMYAASKGAIEAYSKNLAREWGRMGIRSNCVVPGFMETDMSASLSVEQRQRIYARNSLNHATSVESTAATVCFLLSESAASITGQNMFVDSGTI
ncbi:MAG: SDR family NAD(P)-dependent oxidoreductase [Aureliella sp.]